MASSAPPIKVTPEADTLISHAAHFLGKSKKDVVELAIREYIDNHREEINASVKHALMQLGSTPTASLEMLTGLSSADIDAVGGSQRSTPTRPN